MAMMVAAHVVVKTVSGCPTVQSQPEVIEEPETNPSFPQQEEQTDAVEGKIIADYKLDVGYEPEGSDPENKPDAQEEEENSNAHYVKMELP